MSVPEQFFHTLVNPNIALVLLSIGLLAISVEIYHPGATVPAIVGVICLVLAFVAVEAQEVVLEPFAARMFDMTPGETTRLTGIARIPNLITLIESFPAYWRPFLKGSWYLRVGDPEIEARIDHLTPREREVMEMVTEGRSNKEIANALGVSAKTIEAHRARVMEKMQAGSLAELVRMVLAADRDR